MISYKSIKITLQALLLSVIIIVPFVKIRSLYFPFVSGKVYGFRLLVCLAFFFLIWLMLKNGKKNFELAKTFLSQKNILVASIILLFLAQVVVSLLGVSPALSFFSTIERQDGVIQYGFWVLYFLMILYAFKTQKDWKILISVFVGSAFLASCYAWLNLASHDRLEALFGNPSYLAAYLLFAIGFCAIAVERRLFSVQGGPASGWENKFINIFIWAITLFFTLTLFYTQTRGAYLGLASGIFLFCLLSVLFLRKINKKLAIVCAIILAIGVASISGLFLIKDTSFVKERPLLARMTEVTQFWELGSIRERILNWQIALKAFKEKPIFGYGPENFSVAFNKYYDFRIGRGESWFDRVHNQFIEPLATGGIVLFSAFIFLLSSVFYTIFKISKKEKILSFILGGIFLAYIIQGMFLFDTLPIYLGFFPFLAFVVYTNREDNTENKFGFAINKWQKIVLFITAFACLFGIYTTVFLPYKANAAALQFLVGTEQGYLGQVTSFAKKAFDVKSPYTYWELRKRIGWQFLTIIDGDKKLTDQEVTDLGTLYDFIVPELEKFAEYRPSDPQIYYLLPRIYRIGYQKLGKDDLLKAKNLLNKAFTYSNTRVEYYNEMAQVLLLQGKFVEGEKLLEDYTIRMESISFNYFSSWVLGHYYYLAEKYNLAMENYKTARNKGYDFCADYGEYSRYVDSAQNTKEYQEIVDVSLKCIETKGPSADTYFNIALGYFYLGEKEKSKDFFLKTLELDREKYEQYSNFFL